MLASVNANPEAMKMVMSRTPLQRLGSAEEIANIVAFLRGLVQADVSVSCGCA